MRPYLAGVEGFHRLGGPFFFSLEQGTVIVMRAVVNPRKFWDDILRTFQPINRSMIKKYTRISL